MSKKLLFIALLFAGVATMAVSLIAWQTSNSPDYEALPRVVTDDLREILDDDVAKEVVATTSTTTTVATATTTPPPPQGDIEEKKIVCVTPVELTIYLSSADMVVSAPIDVSDSRFNPAKNRLDLHVNEVNGLPCADTELPVKILGHKQDQFCNLVLEDGDKCDYGVQTGDQVLVTLEDGNVIEYLVVEPLKSEVATPLSEIYENFYRKMDASLTPAVMFRKFTEYEQFYHEIFDREDAQDEMWLFTSCGHDIRGGHSQDACAVRTEFSRLITPEELFTEDGGQ